MKNSNVRESPIARDTLLITDAESRVKQRVPKLLLKCSMQQLHNELIASPDYVGLLGSRHANTITQHEQKEKILSHATFVGNKQKKQKTEKHFLYQIFCPLCHLHQIKHIKTKFTLLRICINVACQVHIAEKKVYTKRGHLIAQVHNKAVKWSIKPCIVRKKNSARH